MENEYVFVVCTFLIFGIGYTLYTYTTTSTTASTTSRVVDCWQIKLLLKCKTKRRIWKFKLM